jgi:hypothetical protein
VGGITDRQKTAMYGVILKNFTRFGLLAALDVVLLLLLVATGQPKTALVIGLLMIISQAIDLPNLLYTWRLRQDWQQPKVATVSGTVQIPSNNRLQIADQTFKVNQEAVKNFKSGDTGVLYYAPHSKWILAVEMVKK